MEVEEEEEDDDDGPVLTNVQEEIVMLSQSENKTAPFVPLNVVVDNSILMEDVRER